MIWILMIFLISQSFSDGKERCQANGDQCEGYGDCCEGFCEENLGVCIECQENGGWCHLDSDCCQGWCQYPVGVTTGVGECMIQP